MTAIFRLRTLPNALLLGAVLLISSLPSATQTCRAQEPSYQRTGDVIYGRKFGLALTMDIYQPEENANGIGIIWIGSGGWFSDVGLVSADFPMAPIKTLLSRGYTVFGVVHGSQPRFTIPEAISDLQRAVRFVRASANEYSIDPNKIGICGGSAGGHLSLMMGLEDDVKITEPRDEVDGVSSRVQAVACHYPPTDFLNYGVPGETALGTGILKDFPAPFDFVKWDRSQGFGGRFIRVTDPEEIRAIGEQISPITHVSSDDPPILIFHGDADVLVPPQQSESLMARLKEAGVTRKLIIHEGGGHGWPDLVDDYAVYADWFDQHLLGSASANEQ